MSAGLEMTATASLSLTATPTDDHERQAPHPFCGRTRPGHRAGARGEPRAGSGRRRTLRRMRVRAHRTALPAVRRPQVSGQHRRSRRTRLHLLRRRRRARTLARATGPGPSAGIARVPATTGAAHRRQPGRQRLSRRRSWHHCWAGGSQLGGGRRRGACAAAALRGAGSAGPIDCLLFQVQYADISACYRALLVTIIGSHLRALASGRSASIAHQLDVPTEDVAARPEVHQGSPFAAPGPWAIGGPEPDLRRAGCGDRPSG